jgi:predicted nucleotidyltransferase
VVNLVPALKPEHLERLTMVAPEVARAAGYRLVVLFGSAARGAPHPEDLDVGIVADGAVDTVAAANRFIEALRTQHVDIVDLRRTTPLLAMVAAREGRVLYEARPGEFAPSAGLRHRLVHEYDEIDDALVLAAVRTARRMYIPYIEAVEAYLQGR